MAGLKRTVPPTPIVGKARIVERDFDLDEMMRYAIFELDPPMDGESMRMAHYAAQFADDGEPIPMSDEMEAFSLRRIARSWGYELVE